MGLTHIQSLIKLSLNSKELRQHVIAKKLIRHISTESGSSSVEMCAIIQEGLSRVLVNSEIHVGHDLDGAAYSTRVRAFNYLYSVQV